MKRVVAFLIIIGLLAVGTVAVQAQQASNYEFATTLTLQNTSGSALTNALVPFDINVNALTNDGYLAADMQDILILAQSGGTEAVSIAQTSTTDPARWWIPVSSLADGGTASWTLYTGQNTTTADNPQSIVITNAATATDDLTADLTSLGSFNGATMTLDDVVFTAFPDTGTVNLFSNAGTRAPVLTVSSAGTLTATMLTTCSNTATLTVDTRYDITWIGENSVSGSGSCELFLNQVSQGTSSAGATALTNGTIQMGGALGSYFSVGKVDYDELSSGSPSVQIDCAFEPTDLTETQAGNSGNAWTWQSTTTNCGSGLTFTWTHVQDTTNLTRTVGPITAVSSAANTTGETDPTFVSGTVNTPIDAPYTEGTATTDFGFPLNILAVAADAGSVPLMLLAGTIAAVGAIIAGFGAYKLTRIPAAGTMSAMVIGGVLVYITVLPNVAVLMLVIALVAATFMVDRPLESRG